MVQPHLKIQNTAYTAVDNAEYDETAVSVKRGRWL